MRKLLWMMLATLPTQAMADNEDPIAYKCYYCTPAEMEDVALAQGVGRHYVYDAQNLNIAGFDIQRVEKNLIATPFPAEDWVKRQFKGMMALYNPYYGTMIGSVGEVELLAPGSDHARTYQLLWSHHLSALHPEHERAREVALRFVRDSPTFSFLDTTTSGGKLLRLQYMLDGNRAITAWMGFKYGYGNAAFHFDHELRQWKFHEAKVGLNPIQQQADDFAPEEGNTYFSFSWSESKLAEAFLERAQWASIPVHGLFPTGKSVRFRCERKTDDIQCYID